MVVVDGIDTYPQTTAAIAATHSIFNITNTLLFELFGDQSNVLRVARFPEGNRKAYYFAAGEETVEVKF